MNRRRLLAKAQNGPHNLRSDEFVELVKAFGFRLDHVKGSHYIFLRPDVVDIVNIQERHGQAKGYQVCQFLRIGERLNLTPEEAE